jgi:flagellar protein FliS
MTAATTLANEYLRTRVMSASPEELRMMLLDGALRFARQAQDGLARRDYEASCAALSQCRSIVLELLASISPDGDPSLCDKVRAVLTFLVSELIEIGITRSAVRLQRVIDLLEYERQTWEMVMQRLAADRAAGASPPRTDLCLQA